MKWAATLAVAAVSNPCPDGFADFADAGMLPICLSFPFENTTWHEMRAHCQSLEADLAQLTGDLHRKVMHFIMHQPGYEEEEFWIGGTDEVFEGSWVWIADDTDIPLGTPHWYPCGVTEPDGGTLENYLSLQPPDYFFHSRSHIEFKSGICQI